MGIDLRGAKLIPPGTVHKKSRQMSFEKLYELLILSTDAYDRLDQLLHPFYRRHLSDDQLFTILRDEWIR
jgi:hypothetical protein